MLSASEIKVRLAARAGEVARHLLPGGRMEAGNWCVGSPAGEKGDSMRVQITGSHAGLWADFAGSDKGDLLDLWACVRGISLGQALKEAKSWLGIADPISSVPAKKFSRPKPENIIRLRETPETKVEKYLTDERKLSRDTILKFLVGARNSPSGKGMEIVYPSFEPGKMAIPGKENEQAIGKLASVKYIALNRTPDGKKIITQEPNCAPVLFGWQAFTLGSRTAIICEGQIDAMTWHQWGYEALSVPNGTGDTENWISYEWDNLACFDTIYLSFDMDEPGMDAVVKVAKRLGIHRCLIVKLPMKDANECLTKGVPFEQIVQAINGARAITPNEIKKASDFRAQVHAQIRGEEEESVGLKTKLFGPRFRLRPAEVTIWTGHTSHGKSSVLKQLMVEALIAGEGVAIGSFEEKGPTMVKKMGCCIAFKGEKEITHEEMDQIIDWMGDKLWIYDVFGVMKRDRLEELMKYSVQRHGVKHIVIDSIMKCDLSSEDYESQRQFLNFLCGFAHDYDVHIHVVGHPRKMSGDDTPPGVLDVHGGQAVTAQPDNVVIVWRNKEKEKEREDGKLPDHRENTVPDTVVYVGKQRETGVEFRVKLWMKQKCFRFTQHYGEGQPTFEDFGIIQQRSEEPS
jgi:twinkle protein